MSSEVRAAPVLLTSRAAQKKVNVPLEATPPSERSVTGLAPAMPKLYRDPVFELPVPAL
jgi:hypothetical protein